MNERFLDSLYFMVEGTTLQTSLERFTYQTALKHTQANLPA